MSKDDLNTSVANAKSSIKSNANHWLYFLIGALPTLVSWPEPLNWRAFAAALSNGLIAVKAKMSSNGEEPFVQEVEMVNTSDNPASVTITKPKGKK